MICSIDPWMLHELFIPKSMFRIYYEQFWDTVFGSIRNFIPIRRSEFIGAWLDLFKKPCIIVFIKRGESTEQNVNYNSYWPKINFFAVALTWDDFWSDISWSATCSCCVRVLSNKSCKSEIWNFNNWSFVFRFIK